jgi:putative glycerol-1-phosphate prenyltransferase
MIYNELIAKKAAGQKSLAILIDPDHATTRQFEAQVSHGIDAGVDYFFIGGSLIVNNVLDQCLARISELCDIPLVLFPGNSFQLSYRADALLFLSLVSGRNAELLIGKHVVTAPYLKASPLEILSTGYMLIDGGIPTTVSYISNTMPIPADKTDIAICTAMAAEMLGMKLIFMDAGSGARTPVSTNMIEAVSQVIDIPLIVGGGIRDPEKAWQNVKAGADVIVVGNATENNPSLIGEIAHAVKGHKTVK